MSWEAQAWVWTLDGVTPLTKLVALSLANLGSYDLGGYKITFGNGAQHGSKFVELAMVTREGKLTTR